MQDLNIFFDFLHLVAISNTEQINYAGFAQDGQLSPHTNESYFKISEDTLIGQIKKNNSGHVFKVFF